MHTPIFWQFPFFSSTLFFIGTLLCTGAFTGVGVKVLNDRDRVLIKGAMNADSTFTFTKPDDDFHILYDAGPSHQVIIYMDDIE